MSWFTKLSFMNLLRLSFTAASHKIFRHKALLSNVNIMIRSFVTVTGNSESEQVVEKMMNPRGDCVTYNTLIGDMSKAEDGLSPPDRKATYTSRIEFLCKHDRIDEAYGVLNQMIVSGFSPLLATMNDVLRGFLRIGETTKAYEMRHEMKEHAHKHNWITDDMELSLIQGVSDEATYTSLMNAYLNEGKLGMASNLFYDLLDKTRLFPSLPLSVLHGVIINGLDKKGRTTETNKFLLRVNYWECFDRPILEYHRTLGKNSRKLEFKRVVKLVEGLCIMGLENVFDTLLKSNSKLGGIDDGIVYNLFIIGHCRHSNVDEAYIMYKDMGHYGFACHMFTVLALVKTLQWAEMVNELRSVIEDVLRSCNIDDPEMVNVIVNEFNPQKPDSEALFDVLAEKAKDGLFLKCSYARASA